MGGAQPLAVTMNDGVALCVELDQHRIDRRLETRYLDEAATSTRRSSSRSRRRRAPRPSIGVLGNAAEVLPELVERHRGRQARGR